MTTPDPLAVPATKDDVFKAALWIILALQLGLIITGLGVQTVIVRTIEQGCK